MSEQQGKARKIVNTTAAAAAAGKRVKVEEDSHHCHLKGKEVADRVSPILYAALTTSAKQRRNILFLRDQKEHKEEEEKNWFRVVGHVCVCLSCRVAV